MKAHHTVIAYAANAVYARCRCGWEGTRRPVERGSFGSEQTLQAADREAAEHIKQVTHDDRGE
ncbi:MAG: hypothetical protein ACRDYA_06645 [Egibacteraceae bacterium]